MKLRIKGNSIRLRVTQSELARLLQGESVEETIHFSPAPDACFTYRLQPSFGPQSMKLEWTSRLLTILLPEKQMGLWSKDTEVGIYESLDLGAWGALAVAVEKDFACLDRSDEDNADTFANPNVSAVCN